MVTIKKSPLKTKIHLTSEIWKDSRKKTNDGSYVLKKTSKLIDRDHIKNILASNIFVNYKSYPHLEPWCVGTTNLTNQLEKGSFHQIDTKDSENQKQNPGNTETSAIGLKVHVVFNMNSNTTRNETRCAGYTSSWKWFIIITSWLIILFTFICSGMIVNIFPDTNLPVLNPSLP